VGVAALRTSVRDPPAFAAVYRAHARTVLVHLTRRTFDPEAALELTAETFAQAFASRRRFRGDSDDDVARWLLGIANHVHARSVRRGRAESRALRRLGVQVPPAEPEDLARIVELAGLAALRADVAAGLAALPDAHREAVRLRVVEELPYPEVAARLAVTEQAARARVSRGLRGLRAALEPPAATQEPSP